MLTYDELGDNLAWMANKLVSVATNFILTLLVNLSASEAKDNLLTSAIHIVSLYYASIYRFTKKSLLEVAIEDKSPEAVKLLIDLGEPVNTINFDGKSPLHLAALSGQPIIVQYLLNKGADCTCLTLPIKENLDQSNSIYNQTPLHLAINSGNEEIVKCFVNHLTRKLQLTSNCDLKLENNLSLKDSHGLTPLTLAKKLNHGEIEKLLEEANCILEETCGSLEDKNCFNEITRSEENDLLFEFKIVNKESFLQKQSSTVSEPLSLASIPEEEDLSDTLISQESVPVSLSSPPLSPIKLLSKADFRARLLNLNFKMKSDEEIKYFNRPVSPDGPPGYTPLRRVSFVTEYFEKLDSRRESFYTIESGRCTTPDTGSISDKNGNVFPTTVNNEAWEANKPVEPISIHEAAATGVIEAIAVILSQGTGIDIIDSDNNTPLHFAARYGQLEALRLLLSKGASLRVKNSEGRTALHLACFSGNSEIARELIIKGIDIEAKDNEKNTALHIAASLGHLKIVQVLTSSGAIVNVKNERKQTPLHKASFNGFGDVVDHLVTKGSQVNPLDSEKDTPLHLAAHTGNIEAVRLLLEYGASVDIKNKLKRKPIHEAAYNGSLEVMSLLLDRKTDLNSKDKNGDTALNLAAAQGHTAAIELLLNKGARVNPKKEKATSAVHMASINDHPESLEMLVKRGANVAIRNKNNDTALHFACSQGNTRIVQILLAAGSPLNIKGSEGRTPLHQAVLNGHVKIISLLLENGADKVIKDSDGKTPLHYAKIRGFSEAVQEIEGQ